MKCLKTLGLLAVAAAALMTSTGGAAASTVTAPHGTAYTGTIHAETEGFIVLHNSIGTVECFSTIEGKIEKHGASVTAGGKLSTFHFNQCVGGAVHPVTTPGSLEVHALGGGRGTLTSTGARITVTMFGVECGYSTNNTHLGEVTPASSTTGHGTLDINSASIPRTHGSFFCGSSGTLTGSYKVTSPTGLMIS